MFPLREFFAEPLQRVENHFRRVFERQLFLDPVLKGTDRRQRDVHFLRDLPGSLALAQHAEHLHLAVTQGFQGRWNLVGFTLHKF